MRKLSKEETIKRGCVDCKDVRYIKQFREGSSYRKKEKCCIHPECPYHELDEFDDYKDYLKKIAKVHRST